MLNQKAKEALDQVVSQLQGQKGYVVEVEGYSRSRGMAGVENSQHMAEAVVRYLAEHQIPVWRIHEVAMGNAPVSSDDNSEAKPGSVVRVSLMANSLAALNRHPLAVHRLVRRSRIPRSPPLRVLRRSQRHSLSKKARSEQALTQRENQGRLAPHPEGPFFWCLLD